MDLWFNTGLFDFLDRTRNPLTAGAIEAMILGTATPYTFDPTDEFVSDLVASELDGAPNRVVLTGAAYIRDDATNTFRIDFTDMLFPAVTASLGYNAVVYYWKVTNDADSVLLAHTDFTARTTDANDIELPFSNITRALAITGNACP